MATITTIIEPTARYGTYQESGNARFVIENGTLKYQMQQAITGYAQLYAIDDVTIPNLVFQKRSFTPSGFKVVWDADAPVRNIDPVKIFPNIPFDTYFDVPFVSDGDGGFYLKCPDIPPVPTAPTYTVANSPSDFNMIYPPTTDTTNPPVINSYTLSGSITPTLSYTNLGNYIYGRCYRGSSRPYTDPHFPVEGRWYIFSRAILGTYFSSLTIKSRLTASLTTRNIWQLSLVTNRASTNGGVSIG